MRQLISRVEWRNFVSLLRAPAMLPVQWRRFNFFEKDLVRQGDLPHPELKVLAIAQSALIGGQKISASCATSGRQLLVLGDIFPLPLTIFLLFVCLILVHTQGGVHFVHPDFHVTAFQAFERAVTLVHQLPTSPILITVGDDDEVIDPTVKVHSQL